MAGLVTSLMELAGLEVVRFANGLEALLAAQKMQSSLVILDVNMPGMEGFEVLERLRALPAYRQVPIVMVTSRGSESDIVKGFGLGADDYIVKPFSPPELSARVQRLLRRL
jgi:DNA-binding response OmpR family regulator